MMPFDLKPVRLSFLLVLCCLAAPAVSASAPDGTVSLSFRSAAEAAGPASGADTLGLPGDKSAYPAREAAVSLSLDDGSPEDAIGVNDGTDSYPFLWLNRFTPNPSDFPFQLETVSALFGYPGSTGDVGIGDPFRIVIFEDTDGDGNPGTNAALLHQQSITAQYNNGITWNTWTLSSPVTVNGPGDVLVGLVTQVSAGLYYPASIDTASTNGRSWAGWYASGNVPDPAYLPPDDTWGTIDTFGMPGNWTLRAAGSTAAACSMTCDPSAAPSSGQAPLIVQFEPNITSSNCSGMPTFQWFFGDGGSSTDRDPTHTYSSGGTYAWSVTITLDGVTCTDSGTVTVTGGGGCTLTCSATASPTSGTVPLQVQFNVSATPSNCSGNLTYGWQFGDGGTSADFDPTHTYSSPGTYNWSVTASIDGQTCTRTGTVVASSGSGGMPGDCDGNGSISIGEVQQAINMFLGAAIGCNVDVNQNGSVSIGEVQQVINGFLGVSQITVSVTPSAVTLDVGQTQQFTATVSGTGNQAVTWSVQEGPSGGTITQSGFYTAPAQQGTYHVVATSQADASRKGYAVVTVGPATTEYGIILGTVKNTAGTLLGGVDVSVGALTGQSNDQGYFVIPDVPATERASIRFHKEGYIDTWEITKIVTGQNHYLEVFMAPEGFQGTLSGSSGGTVEDGEGGSVSIGSNGLVDSGGMAFTGTANVSVTSFDPTDDNQLYSFPGDFEGVTLSGETIFFVTFGWMDVTLSDAGGGLLQLAEGSTADITIPVPDEIKDDAPPTLPQWYFNPDDGKWHEEGTFTLVQNTQRAAGFVYEGSISHFSIWNCDVGRARCEIIGRVVDGQGNPVQGARVTMKNLGPRGRYTSGETSTPPDGTFRIPVDADSEVEYWASKGGKESEHATTPTCPDGGVRNVGDIYLDAPPVKVTLTWGADPRDLDAHLTIPDGAGGWHHVYYQNYSERDADLDTDDQWSYGPEIMTVRILHEGTYRYCVHQYAGSGDFPTSGALVNLVVDGVGIYNFYPPAQGAGGDNDVWRVFDLQYDASSGHISVSTVGDYLHDVLSSDLSSFIPD